MDTGYKKSTSITYYKTNGMERTYNIMQTIVLNNIDDTKRFAQSLSVVLRAGDVVSLEGEIGAGKTTLTTFLMPELGVLDDITSPTFAIVVPYEGKDFKVFHSDVYRIEDEEELYNIGFEDYFRDDSLILIEWADTIIDYLEELSDKIIRIDISRLDGDLEKRNVTIDWYDDRRLEW